jgi:hypothetical protein
VAACRAVASFPVVLGWLEQQSEDNTLLLRWDSSSSRQRSTFSWEVCSVPGPSPCIWSSWELWRYGALPAAGGWLAAAKVWHATAQPAEQRDTAMHFTNSSNRNDLSHCARTYNQGCSTGCLTA